MTKKRVKLDIESYRLVIEFSHREFGREILEITEKLSGEEMRKVVRI